MAEKTWINISGTWKQLYSIWYKKSGAGWQPGIISWRKIGVTWKKTMDYAGIGPPIALFESNDGTVNPITNTSSTSPQTGYTTLDVYWTPNGMAVSPCTNYIDVYKAGPVGIGSGSRAVCRNGMGPYMITITLSEALVAGATYYINIQDNNL